MAQDNEYEVVAAIVFDEKPAVDSQQDAALQALGNELVEEFRRAENDRQLTEQRWLKDLRQYRGQYDPEVEARIGPARSKAFVRKTRVKVKTTDSRVADLLFPAGADQNWSIEETPKPTLTPEIVAEIQQQLMAEMQQQLQAQAQQALQQGVPPEQVQAQMAQMAQQMGPPPMEAIEARVLAIAKERAKKMSKVIDDQLVEARYKQVALKTIHSGHLYGVGIMKGPLVEKRIRTRFVKDGSRWVAKTEQYTVPFIDFVPVWRFYPDMSATELQACRYVYERHTMTRKEFADLAERKSFAKGRQKIIDWINSNPKGHGTPRYWDNEVRSIGERNSTHGDVGGTYEVLERWGWLSGEQLMVAGVEVPEDRRHETFFSNVWMLPNGCILKVVLQPLNGVTWPYYLYYFDKDESTIFPEGLASIMRDDQEMLNAATRLMIDNAAITSGPQLEVSPHLLTTNERVQEVTPWKVWLRNEQSPGQPAIREINLNPNLRDLSAMAAMFENNADETTAIPRYMSGENVSSGAAGTAAGMSMLMGAVNIVIKDLITAYDEGVTIGFIKALYAWNMQFNPDDSIKGDFDVKATGTASLVAKEVRARQLNEFSQLTANELDAPWIKRGLLNKLRAEAHELLDVVKTQEEFDAEQNSPQAQAQMQMQEQMMQLQAKELESRVQKALADAQRVLAEAEKAKASIDLVRAQTIERKVNAAYVGLQAGGAATANPIVAPAGDEILRSSGWEDATPNPSIGSLGEMVQGMPPGQPQPQQMPGQPQQPRPEQGLPPDAGAPEPQVLDGHAAGIETPGFEQPGAGA